MPPITMPKTLDIPPVEEIHDLETCKAWLQYLTELLMFWFEHSQSDVAYIGEGNVGDTGKWRFKEVGEYLQVQKKIDGVWTECGYFGE